MSDHSPRSATVLLLRALGYVDLIEPASARTPIKRMFEATIELCAVSSSLLGRPVGYVLDLAQALVDAAKYREQKQK